MDLNPLTQEDVADILALLDSLPYDELDLETPRFRLTLRRAPGGWTQATEVRTAPTTLTPAPPGADEVSEAGKAGISGGSAPAETASMEHRGRSSSSIDVPSMSFESGRGAGRAGVVGTVGDGESAGAGEAVGGAKLGAGGAELVAVRAPLPGTFYRAPRPGAAPFVEVGSRVGADTVIGIVETMKLMNSVPAGVAGTVAEFCVANAEFAAHGATLLRIRADR
jgi:acetyl-CoA carboxylase biotin carboxyl carrier protein